MKLKKIIGFVHLWLGLVCGSVVVVSMAAASLYAWEEELSQWYYQEAIFVKQKGATVLPFDIIFANAQKALPDKPLNGFEVFNSGEKSYVFYTYYSCDTCPGWFQWKEKDYWYQVYVDPYTAQVKEVVDMRTNWISLTRYLHQNLLLRYEVGHYVVGFSTLFVFVLVITGLILWFPRNKAALKQRFKISFKYKWRRVNYDIHNVGGFYTWVIILTLAATGLVWTFEWWENRIYRLLGSEPDQVYATLPPFKTADTLHFSAMDKALASFSLLRPSWTKAYVAFPAQEKDSVSEISVYMEFNTHSGWVETDDYHIHPITGDIISSSLQETKTTAAKWRNSNYAIHVGSIYGWPTKVLASFCTLFLASLPITGFYVWWGRKKKRKKASLTKTFPSSLPVDKSKAPKMKRSI